MASAYLHAGVNVDAANSVKAGFAELLEKRGITLSRKNAFAAIIDPGFSRFRDPLLVLKSEEPGSKQLSHSTTIVSNPSVSTWSTIW